MFSGLRQVLTAYGPIWALYGGAALLSLALSWHDRPVRSVSLALLASFVVSNLVWFFGQVSDRPGVYTALQMWITTRAWLAWVECKHKEPCSRAEALMLLAVVGLSVVYISVNVAFTLTFAGQTSQLRQHEITTNLLYLAQCLLVAGVGVWDGARFDRFRHWPALRRINLQRYGSAYHKEPED